MNEILPCFYSSWTDWDVGEWNIALLLFILNWLRCRWMNYCSTFTHHSIIQATTVTPIYWKLLNIYDAYWSALYHTGQFCVPIDIGKSLIVRAVCNLAYIGWGIDCIQFKRSYKLCVAGSGCGGEGDSIINGDHLIWQWWFMCWWRQLCGKQYSESLSNSYFWIMMNFINQWQPWSF